MSIVLNSILVNMVNIHLLISVPGNIIIVPFDLATPYGLGAFFNSETLKSIGISFAPGIM